VEPKFSLDVAGKRKILLLRGIEPQNYGRGDETTLLAVRPTHAFLLKA